MIFLNKHLDIISFLDVVIKNESIDIDDTVIDEVNESYDFLNKYSKDKVIYGINTGFGPMAQYKVSDNKLNQLQYNLIRSHTAGTGTILSKSIIKASMLARLNSLLKGKSGVHLSLINILKTLINKNIYPVIFSHGGVGASGDLVQLAHIANVLIGEGEVIYNDKICNTKTVFEKEGIEPLKIKIREGLALMNGTSVMTGLGIINYANAKKLINYSVACSSLINEIVLAYDDHFSSLLNEVKKHEGQQTIAKMMRDQLSESKRIKKRQDSLYNGKSQEKIFEEKVQEYYSIRCVPQILGPIFDSVQNCGIVLENELNSVNDNPIVDAASKNVYHGGNFHGDYVSLEMDKLKTVVTKMSMLMERQLNYLLNDKINKILPPFINRGVLGLNYGMQGAQFTATSTTAENQTLSNPMYVHSIPCNNDNQDIVSMGTNAALMANKVIENTFEVLSIEIITIIQCVEHLGIKKDLSPKSVAFCDQFKNLIHPIIEDESLYKMINDTKNFLIKN